MNNVLWVARRHTAETIAGFNLSLCKYDVFVIFASPDVMNDNTRTTDDDDDDDDDAKYLQSTYTVSNGFLLLPYVCRSGLLQLLPMSRERERGYGCGNCRNG